MTKHKLGLAALLAAAVVFGAAACGPKASETPAATEAPAGFDFHVEIVVPVKRVLCLFRNEE